MHIFSSNFIAERQCFVHVEIHLDILDDLRGKFMHNLPV